MTSAVGYFLEGVYYLTRRHVFKMKHSNVSYFVVCLTAHLFMAWFGVYCHGFLASSDDYGLALGLLVIVDLLLIDSLIVCYAFCASHNDQMLQLFAFRGFFLNPSSLWIYKESKHHEAHNN